MVGVFCFKRTWLKVRTDLLCICFRSLHTDHADDHRGGRHLRCLLASSARHYPSRRPWPLHLQPASYEHCLGLLSLAGHESLLLQPLRLLWNEQTVSEQLKESAEALPHSQTVAWRRPVFPSGVHWWGGVQHARVHPLISQVIQWTLCPQSSFVIELQSIRTMYRVPHRNFFLCAPSPDITLSGWLDSKHQLTKERLCTTDLFLYLLTL